MVVLNAAIYIAVLVYAVASSSHPYIFDFCIYIYRTAQRHSIVCMAMKFHLSIIMYIQPFYGNVNINTLLATCRCVTDTKPIIKKHLQKVYYCLCFL